MKSGKVFAVMGVLAACATGGFIAMRKMVPRAEPLPFADRAPAGTILYVALPDHAAIADALAASPAWKALGLAPLLERHAAGRAKLAEVAGPSAGLFVRRDGSWAAMLHLRGWTTRQEGETGGFRWIADGDVLCVAGTAADAEAALKGPASPLELEEDRMEVCGASRAPFAWLDLRPWIGDDGRVADIGAVALTATFGESVTVRAVGNYFSRARPRAIRDFVHRPAVSPAPPADAALWISGFLSAGDLWPLLLNRMAPEDRERIHGELDRLSVEHLKRGSIERDVIPRIGPEAGLALTDASAFRAWVTTPEGFEDIFRRFSDDFAEHRRRLELEPLWLLEGSRIRSTGFPAGDFLAPSLAFGGGRLSVVSRGEPVLPPPPVTGRWHIAGELDADRLRRALDGIDRGIDLKEMTGALRSALDRVPWLRRASLRGRYTDRGLLLELTCEPRSR